MADLNDIVPGVLGSMTAMLFGKGDGGWKRRLAVCAAGVAFAWAVGPSVAPILRSGGEVAGYLSGLFGMALISKIFDTIGSFDSTQAARDLWAAILKRIGG